MKKGNIKMTIPIINCGDASQTGMEELGEAFNALPTYVRKGLEDHRFQLVLGRFVSSTHPSFKDWDRVSAFHAPTIKTIFCSEFYRIGETEYPSTITDDLSHEIGHFVDLVLAGTGKYPDGYSSVRELFKAAAREDTKRLAKDNYRQVYDAAVNAHGNADCAEPLIAHFKRIFLDSAAGNREIYADIFANIQGRCSSVHFPIQPLFPQFAALVQADLNRLDSVTMPKRASTTSQRVRAHRVKKCSIGSP